MKSFLFSVLLISLSYVNFSSAKDLDAKTIVEKSLAQRSYKAIEKVNDIIIDGFVVNNNTNGNKFSYYYYKDFNQRLKFQSGGLVTNMAISYGNGWLKLGAMGSIPIDDISRCYLSVLASVIKPNIFKYRDNSDSIFSAGSERISGIDCYKVVLIDTLGIHNYYYFAKVDFRLLKFSVIKEINSESALIEVYYEDYKDFDELKLPASIESYIGAKEFKLKIEKLNYDSGLSDSDFVRPN